MIPTWGGLKNDLYLLDAHRHLDCDEHAAAEQVSRGLIGAALKHDVSERKDMDVRQQHKLCIQSQKLRKDIIRRV
ncbi:hypothetical protein DL89DRAFT_82552 [Linderina pennispora]|uniref:Uncharacterized protein n=1 Tax=Linderina pennispora TaxID=61395 RepID=A0A1Y1WH07_9FUNG|nr:uncharacterized protein DL89DRAFT_82552 [Linderina pennispora]ORX72752.1 hypothetical protein DL89DRAFT_82552 [Linderina pennispora]